MGRASCGRRFLLLLLCLQLVATGGRQVFNFLGPLWLPILADFLHLLVLVVALFGATIRHFAYLALYACWQVVWLGWSLFALCLFLEVGVLRRDNGVLDLSTGISSWWEVAGPGCKPVFALLPHNSSSAFGEASTVDPALLLPPRPLRVDGCLLDPQYVEGVQAALQALMAILGLAGATVVLHSIRLHDRMPSSRTKRRRPSLYSIQVSEVRGGDARGDTSSPSPLPPEESSSRPLTPRRVKRRSLRGSSCSPAATRGSSRKSRSGPAASGPTYVNPVTRLLERANGGESSTSTDSVTRTPLRSSLRTPSRGHTNPLFQMAPELPRPASAHSAYSNFHGLRPLPLGQPLPWANHPPPPQHTSTPLTAETVI